MGHLGHIDGYLGVERHLYMDGENNNQRVLLDLFAIKIPFPLNY